jgi:hypothetical protein
MKVLVRWNMPEGHNDVIKKKIVEVEKTGIIYLHFFPNDDGGRGRHGQLRSRRQQAWTVQVRDGLKLKISIFLFVFFVRH